MQKLIPRDRQAVAPILRFLIPLSVFYSKDHRPLCLVRCKLVHKRRAFCHGVLRQRRHELYFPQRFRLFMLSFCTITIFTPSTLKISLMSINNLHEAHANYQHTAFHFLRSHRSNDKQIQDPYSSKLHSHGNHLFQCYIRQCL